MGMLAGLGQAGMGAYQGFGGGYKDPTKGAMNYLNQIPGAAEGYLSPYMNAGKGALGDLQNQYKDLLSGGTYGKLAEGYKESPGYKYQLEQALGAGGNAAAAGGMLGTPMHEAEAMKTAQGLTSQDFNNYMNSQMGLYGLGLHGTEGLGQMGFQGAGHMADTMANTLGSQASLDYAGRAGENQYKQQGWQNLFSGFGQMGGSALGMPWLQEYMNMRMNKGGTQ
jgi:hypothetical protein